MLPDGAHLRSEDWTIFYLNQTPRNAVAPVLSSESPSSTVTTANTANKNDKHDDPHDPARKAGRETSAAAGGGEELGELLFVLNCVRMKEDKSVRR
jgi:hypothetical protein